MNAITGSGLDPQVNSNLLIQSHDNDKAADTQNRDSAQFRANDTAAPPSTRPKMLSSVQNFFGKMSKAIGNAFSKMTPGNSNKPADSMRTGDRFEGAKSLKFDAFETQQDRTQHLLNGETQRAPMSATVITRETTVSVEVDVENDMRPPALGGTYHPDFSAYSEETSTVREPADAVNFRAEAEAETPETARMPSVLMEQPAPETPRMPSVLMDEAPATEDRQEFARPLEQRHWE